MNIYIKHTHTHTHTHAHARAHTLTHIHAKDLTRLIIKKYISMKKKIFIKAYTYFIYNYMCTKQSKIIQFKPSS